MGVELSINEPTPAELASVLTRAETARTQAETRKLHAEADRNLAEAERFNRVHADEDAAATAARVFTFYGEVNSASVASCMAALGHWSRRDNNEPIKVIFASPGGSVFDGFALFDFLRELSANGSKIETVALGFAFSMGTVLLQAGDNRVMGPNAWLMIHDVASDSSGGSTEQLENSALVRRLEERCLTLLAERSTLSVKQIRDRQKRRRTGWYVDAKEALTLGFCDEIR